ncbi:MAG: hypothetical protein ACXVAN_00915 [Polyangia bacterium]
MTSPLVEPRTWGGRRRGAGRPSNGARAGVPHLCRAPLASRFPVHASWRLREGVWRLQAQRSARALSRAMHAGAARFGFRLVHYAVIGSDLHLIVEAPDRRALGRAMKGLGVRIARALNRVRGRRGPVISDRYRARILTTPSAVRRARNQLVGYVRPRDGHPARDHAAARTPLVTPRTWLLLRLVRR